MTQPVKLNNACVDELKKSFRLRDYDNDGQVFSRDVSAVIRSVKGLKPSEAEIKEIMQIIDENGGTVDLQTLVKLVSSKVTEPEADTPTELAEMFKMYDKEGRGFISVQEMKHVLTSIGEKLTDVEVEDILKHSGALQRGQVDYNKFTKVVCSS